MKITRGWLKCAKFWNTYIQILHEIDTTFMFAKSHNHGRKIMAAFLNCTILCWIEFKDCFPQTDDDTDPSTPLCCLSHSVYLYLVFNHEWLRKGRLYNIRHLFPFSLYAPPFSQSAYFSNKCIGIVNDYCLYLNGRPYKVKVTWIPECGILVIAHMRADTIFAENKL